MANPWGKQVNGPPDPIGGGATMLSVRLTSVLVNE